MNISLEHQNVTCRKHDKSKGGVEIAFFPIYSLMFVLSVLFNSLLLHVVTKRVKFCHDKRTFHKLFQILIILDLIISILIFPNVIIKAFSKDTDTHWSIDFFLASRDFAISSQMITLVLIAIDRLLAFFVPMSKIWKLEIVMGILKVLLASTLLSYLARFVLLTIDIPCKLKKRIDGFGKDIIGISGGVFMMFNLLSYMVLFSFLCRRHLYNKQQSMNSERLYMSMQINKSKMNSTSSVNRTEITEKDLKANLKQISVNRRIGSIKFVKVLLGVNVLMITSFSPAILYNADIINFPTFSVYYLFFLHSLGDPILFFLTQKELKNGLISIFKRT